MFPLSGKEFPASSAELAAAIEGSLTEVFTLPSGGTPVTAKGGKFPAIKSVRVDLDRATVSLTTPPPAPVGVGKRKAGITVETFEVSGHPISYEAAKLDLGVTAKGVTFDFDRDKQQNPLLVLTNAESGKVSAKISKADLQAVLLAAATAAAKEQGVAIQELTLDLSADGPRSVTADVRVKAKKMMMSGVIHLRGHLEVDDALNATISGLQCNGEGLVGGAAAGFLRKKIEPFDGTKIPLLAFSLGDVTLRDLQMKLNGSLEVTAAFGKK